jgi:endogenous inhibitor of DNA gyrase (YacG/DUF329 family)
LNAKWYEQVRIMEPGNAIPCPECGARSENSYPFCPQCGELQPGILAPGDVSVELQDVASEKIRRQVVDALKSWFPAIDTLTAEEALKRSGSVLISGISEESARRIVRALNAMKAGARATRGDTPARNLLNRGLVVSALALLAAPFVGLGAILCLLVAVGAPLIGARLKSKRRQPLLTGTGLHGEAEEWVGLSKEYAQVIRALEPQDADLVRTIALGVFDLRRRLGGKSLAATAAGETVGDLHQRVQEILRSAIALTGRIPIEAGEKKERLRQDLEGLKNLVEDTVGWFHARETGQVRKASALSDDLQKVKGSIDAILHEVRSPEISLPREKTRV